MIKITIECEDEPRGTGRTLVSALENFFAVDNGFEPENYQLAQVHGTQNVRKEYVEATFQPLRNPK